VESAEEGGINAFRFWPDAAGAASWLLCRPGASGKALEEPGERMMTRRTTPEFDAWTDAARVIEGRALPGDSPALS
jgi:hypothetical protein